MDCPNPEVAADMMKRFSKTLNKVLLAYADMVQKDFPKFAHDEKLACILMNNVQQLRFVFVSKFFKINDNSCFNFKNQLANFYQFRLTVASNNRISKLHF